ncbi:hypothetical protein QQ045_003662 [Rhodiola kirilowii]
MSNRGTLVSPSLLLTLALCSIASATVFFEERFDDEGWEKRWVVSEWKKAENASGVWNYTAGKWNGDPNDKGIQTSEDMKFYAISAEFPKFSNKNKMLVFQFSVKNEQKLHCGGAYLKLLSGDIDQNHFGGGTPYSIMFGPDICGHSTKKVHAILNYNGTCHPNKKNLTAETDQLTHVYTFVLRPDATYSVLIDNEDRQKGSLYQHWDLLPPKKIKDPDAEKPEDCDDRTYIDDKKPEGHCDIPKEIPDPDAEKPGDWDEEENGEWKPPTIANPDYNGQRTQKQIKNPNCKEEWTVPLIDNPEFKDDPDLYVYPNLKYVGIEVWQVKSGSLFDNILITDDPEHAKKFAEETWGKHKDAEKAAFEEFERATKEKEAEKGSADSDVSVDTNKDKDADNKSDANDEHHADDTTDIEDSKASEMDKRDHVIHLLHFHHRYQFLTLLVLYIIF